MDQGLLRPALISQGRNAVPDESLNRLSVGNRPAPASLPQRRTLIWNSPIPGEGNHHIHRACVAFIDHLTEAMELSDSLRQATNEEILAVTTAWAQAA